MSFNVRAVVGIAPAQFPLVIAAASLKRGLTRLAWRFDFAPMCALSR